MAALMPQGKQQYFTAGGIPLVGGKVYTYAAGTTTPLATYTTAAANTPNTNPVILDSRGEASIFFSAANYKIVVKDSLDSTIWTQDNLPGDQAATILANLAASTGSSLVGHIASGTGAVATTVQGKLRESVSVKDFGAVGDGVTDDTTAFNNALATNGFVEVPTGTYKITSQLVITYAIGLIGQGIYTSVLNKTFNGDLMRIDSNGFVMQEIGIAGNGATYTGGGVRPRGYNISIHHCKIDDTADSPIIVEDSSVSNTLAATYLKVDSCFLLPTSTSTYAARLVTPDGTAQGTDASTRPTCRVFSNISGGGNLVDFSGMNYATLDESLGSAVKFNASSGKIHMGGGNRITSAAESIVIYGQDHIIDGNFWGFGAGQSLTIDSTATNVTFGPNNPISIGGSFNSSVAQNLTVGQANPNTVYSRLLSNPTLPWLGSGGNPTIGNGLFTSYYKQEGRMCEAQIQIIVGTTTSVGSGNYSFQLPFKALVSAFGTAMIISSAGVYYPGFFVVNGGSSVGYIYFAYPAYPGGLFASSSIALSSGASIQAQISFQIAVS